MSGPKSARYRVNVSVSASLAAQRRINMAIAAQRKREEMERIRKEAERLLNQLLGLGKSIDSTKSELVSFDEFASIYIAERGKDSFVLALEEISKRLQKIQQEITAHSTKKQSNNELSAAYNKLSAEYQVLQKEIRDMSVKMQVLRKDLMDSLSNSGAELFNMSHQADIEKKQEAEKASETLLADKKFAESVFDKLVLFQHSPAATKELREQISKAVLKFESLPEEQLKAYAEIELKPLLRQCDDMQKLWDTDGSTYTALLSQYYALLERNNHTSDAVEVPFSTEAIQTLTTLIKAEETAAAQADEQAYIANAVSEAMSELGYDTWGERDVHKRNGTHFQNKLYHYNENTAINVTYRDNGQITMELGKTDTQDRLPSDSEAIVMEQQMETFCDDFARVEAALKEKGVILNERVQLMPPSREFAQIINLNDFDVPSEKTAANQQRKVNELRHADIG